MSSDAPDPGVDFTDPADVFDPAKRDATRLDPNDGLIELVSNNWPRTDEGLQISGGGAVAVDTATLRFAALDFDDAREELAAIAASLAGVQATLRRESYFADDARASASVLATKLESVQTEAQQIAEALREAAYAYEFVELSAEARAALLSGDPERAKRLGRRLDRLIAEHPDAVWAGLTSEWGHALKWPSELVRQGTQWGVSVGAEVDDRAAIGTGAAVGLLTIAGAAVVGFSGSGRISRDATLSGAAGPVTVTRTAASTSGSAASVAPRSLADVTERMPGAGDARVRVERYTMPDGSRQFAVYIAGTQSQSVVGGEEPWDNTSNAQLYSGQMSDSYAATAEALAAAGVKEGETVHLFGYSQGGMIGAHLALEGGYDVATLVTVGAPVAADVDAGTLSIAVRHTDDPIAGLAGGGFGEAVGAPGSFVAERVSDPDPGIDDAQLPAHTLKAYAETAALVDASTDPRIDQMRDVFDELAQADKVKVTEYAATRGDG